jgi:hypothetical protein
MRLSCRAQNYHRSFDQIGISHLVTRYSNMKDRLPGGLLAELSRKAGKAVEEGGFSLNSREVS